MKELDRYLGTAYSNSCQPVIMTKTPEAFPELEIPNIMTDTGCKRPKTDSKMAYLENKDTNEVIYKKLSKRDEYETDMNIIYNLIVGHTNEQIQEKAESDATFHTVKASRYPIGYMNILKNI